MMTNKCDHKTKWYGGGVRKTAMTIESMSTWTLKRRIAFKKTSLRQNEVETATCDASFFSVPNKVDFPSMGHFKPKQATKQVAIADKACVIYYFLENNTTMISSTYSFMTLSSLVSVYRKWKVKAVLPKLPRVSQLPNVWLRQSKVDKRCRHQKAAGVC